MNSGKINDPLRSLDAANKKLSEGDTIFIRKGIYHISKQLKIKSSVHILAYNKENVVIHGTNQVQNWSYIEKNIWKITTKDSIIQLFINELPYFQAAYPNIPENMDALTKGAFSIAYPTKELFIKGLNQFANVEGAKVLGLHGKGLVSLNGTISKQNGENVLIENNAFYWGEAYRKEYLDTGMAFVIGSKQFLDTEKEWYWEKGELYLISEIDPNLLSIESRTNLYTFDFSNCTNCKIEGVSFVGANINLTNATKCSLSNCSFKYPTPFFTFPDGFERFNFLINSENQIYFDPPEKWTGKGITISGSNNTIENCYIAHSWGDGLTVWGTNHIIRNNEIYDCDWIANDCAPLTITGNGHIIEYNTIHKGARSILVHRKLENSFIRYNHLYDAGILCEDLGITYCYDTDGKNTEIAYNYLHDNKVKQSGAGLYLDNTNKNFNIHHNIITNSFVGININKPSENIQIYNNTLYNNFYSMGSWGPQGFTLKNVKTFNNLTNTNRKARWNYDAFYGTEIDSNHVYFENNIFQDPQNHNFQLKKYSYPIDKGIKNELTSMYNGVLPDMGAIESESIPWKYGSSLQIPNEKYYKPKAPINLKLVNNTPTITLFEWEYPYELIDTFYIERKLSTDTFKIIARIPANVLIYDDAFQLGGEYRYQVRAKNQYGISEPSNSIELYNPFANEYFFLDAENSDLQNGTTSLNDQLINNDNKDWIVYKHIDFKQFKFDACRIQYAVPCENAWQEVQVRLDEKMGRMIGKFTPLATGAWDKFKIDSIPLEKTTGIHDVYFRFKGAYGVGTFDWFSLYNSEGKINDKTLFPIDPDCPNPKSNTTKDIAIKLFPNPGNERLVVTFENNEVAKLTIQVVNLNGKNVYEAIYNNLDQGTIEIYLEDNSFYKQIDNGVYLVKVNIESKHHNQETTLKYIRL